MKHFTLLTSLLALSLGSLTNNAAAQDVTLERAGNGVGIFYAFYFGERDIDRIDVPCELYSDGSIVLKNFANGHDITLTIAEEDEYGELLCECADVEGAGYNDTFTYEGYENWPFSIYRFEQPVTIGPDQIEFFFLDGTTYFDPIDQTLVMDYQSAIDGQEYMFLVDMSELPEAGPTALTTIHAERNTQTYDLFGRHSNTRGIRIVNGLKSLVK